MPTTNQKAAISGASILALIAAISLMIKPPTAKLAWDQEMEITVTNSQGDVITIFPSNYLYEFQLNQDEWKPLNNVSCVENEAIPDAPVTWVCQAPIAQLNISSASELRLRASYTLPDCTVECVKTSVPSEPIQLSQVIIQRQGK